MSYDEAAIWTTSRLPLILAGLVLSAHEGHKAHKPQIDCYIIHPFARFLTTSLFIPAQFIQSALLLAGVPLLTEQVMHSKEACQLLCPEDKPHRASGVFEDQYFARG